jgi:predicted HTH transcriptional regulator
MTKKRTTFGRIISPTSRLLIEGPKSAKQIADILGDDRETVTRRISKMLAEGRVTVVHEGNFNPSDPRLYVHRDYVPS